MKKVLALVLLVALMLSLTACGAKLEGSELRWSGPVSLREDDTAYYAKFKDGVLTIEKYEYASDPNSPSGKSAINHEEQTYTYEMKENNTIVIDGTKTYTYEISGEDVTFNSDFMNITRFWEFN